MTEPDEKKILLAHGGGGRLTENLIKRTILPKFNNEILNKLTDSAQIDIESAKLFFTTDSYVVKPLFFNGGDIGKLAVCGTINDLAVAGAKPVALTLSLIIEEGLQLDTLEKILESAARTAADANVKIVAGDTKVVESGAADRLFINTAGVGEKIENANLAFDRISPGDKIIINGCIGDHGMTIMSERENLNFDTPLQSDCASLAELVAGILQTKADVKFMRDPTRGGVAAALNGQTYDLPLVLGSPTSCKWYLEVTKESGNYGYTEYYEDSSCETLDYTYYYTVMQIVVVLQSNSGFWIEIRLMSSGGITDVFAFTYSTWYLTGLCADMEDTFINDAEFECGEEELELHPCLESGSVAVVFL